MNGADPFAEWLWSYLDRTAPQQGRASSWWTWTRLYGGIAVMALCVGVTVHAAPGPGALVVGWAVATAVGLDVTMQTLTQTEGYE
ncbi:hypothetical protein [Actinomadura sp. NEAU-AAG7]|uniref:hypothetical protein n=1 Tax=Actinomadura sp. NEAU-AAG7 TaxID=2839640 RepID=UPI001BE41B44|nr:hypothetical protein [Actinomadura sp. NEAU-AAG7]MBT2213492.1 hypothetical protein [Actinomadura sp. NEAU-AAG7]